MTGQIGPDGHDWADGQPRRNKPRKCQGFAEVLPRQAQKGGIFSG
jgi:hypothetical protein